MRQPRQTRKRKKRNLVKSKKIQDKMSRWRKRDKRKKQAKDKKLSKRKKQDKELKMKQTNQFKTLSRFLQSQ